MLDMQLIHLALARVNEKYATASRAVALELMWFFNRAYATASRYFVKVQGERDLAKKRAGEIRAIIILDKLPEELKKRSIWDPKHPTGNAEIREAIIALDPDYQKVSGVLDNTEALVEYFRGVKESFEMAYNSAKKMLGDASSMASRPNPNLIVNPNTNSPSPSEPDDFFGETR